MPGIGRDQYFKKLLQHCVVSALSHVVLKLEDNSGLYTK